VVRKYSEGPGPNGEPTIVERIVAGEVVMVINTPSGVEARADGYEIRAATTSMDRPIITTVQQLGAAVQGIESQLTESVRVKSLQDHARELSFYVPVDDADDTRTDAVRTSDVQMEGRA
jgi:carbamoyl-phosphate synthase large subunit